MALYELLVRLFVIFMIGVIGLICAVVGISMMFMPNLEMDLATKRLVTETCVIGILFVTWTFIYNAKSKSSNSLFVMYQISFGLQHSLYSD